VAFFAVAGCGKEDNAKDYASFQPASDEIGFEVRNIMANDVKEIRTKLESISAIDPASIRIYPEGSLVVFRVGDSDSSTTVAKEVLGVLRELGLEASDGFKLTP